LNYEKPWLKEKKADRIAREQNEEQNKIRMVIEKQAQMHKEHNCSVVFIGEYVSKVVHQVL